MKKTTLILLLICTAVSLSAQNMYRQQIAILGDSYSTFKDYVMPDTNICWYSSKARMDNNVNDVKQTWWHLLANEMGYRICTNNSFSGATICNTGYNKADYSDRSFITRMKYLGSPDKIFICGGTNDSWAGAPIGEYKYADWTKQELYSFRPAMAYMLDFMTKRYVNAKIYFILNSELSKEVTESTIEICRHYDVPCIELKDIEKQSGHPSVKGMKAISDQVAEYLRKTQMNNFRRNGNGGGNSGRRQRD